MKPIVMTAEKKEQALKMYHANVDYSTMVAKLGVKPSNLSNFLSTYRGKSGQTRKYSKIDNSTRSRIFELYNQGKTTSNIAIDTGVSISSIHRLLVDNNLHISRAYKQIPHETKKQVLTLASCGNKIQEIADNLGLTYKYTYNLVYKNHKQ